MTRSILFVVFLGLNFQTAGASEEVTTHKSPNDVIESCVALAKIPGGDYSKKDVESEGEYCEMSFYQEGIAICPKTWSTSPGTMVYDVSDSEFSKSAYENSKYCGQKSKGPGVSTFVKYKQTMNANDTSGTFSQSSLLYYHFSRYFDTKVTVPVAVYREMDRKAHLKLVTEKGYSKASSAMIKAGWKRLLNAEKNPESYSPWTDLFTEDQSKIYGVLLRGKGARYGSEFNGTRASGWGVGQNMDFQKTPGYLALRNKKSLEEAIPEAISQAKKDSKMRKDLVSVSNQQMVLWMRELIEITLLDYIFSQQDRVGNIDYLWYWYYVENGEAKSKREKRDQFEELPRSEMGQITPPESIASLNPVLVQRTQINDNDAGGRIPYANFAKKAKMLENLHHYSAKTYTLLMQLDRDLQSQGEIYQWLVNSIDLNDARVRQVVKNTHLAANLLRSQCETLQFDLDNPDDYLLGGQSLESVDCSL